MQKLFSNVVVIITLVMLSTNFTGCSKDDDEASGDRSAAAIIAGTYNGTQDNDIYNVTLTVTDLNNGFVQVSVPNATPKNIQVTDDNITSIIQFEDDQGFISYDTKTKVIYVSTEKTAANEVSFYFEGKKVN